MDKNKFMCIMFTVVQTLCTSIKNYYNISYSEARNLLYHSKLYGALEDEETKMWHFSNYNLFEMFLNERETGKLSIYGG